MKIIDSLTNGASIATPSQSPKTLAEILTNDNAKIYLYHFNYFK